MDFQFIFKATDLTAETIAKRVQYYAKLDMEKQIFIEKKRRDFFLRFSPEERKNRNAECSYASFVMAVHDFFLKDPKTKGKKDIADLSLAEQEIHYNRLVQEYRQKNKKKAPIKNAIILKSPIITAMRKAGMSWEMVSDELWRTHRLKADPRYVFRTMKEVEAKLEKYQNAALPRLSTHQMRNENQ